MGLTFTPEEAPNRTLPQDSIHRARLMEISQRTINWVDKKTNEPQSRELLEWWWEITATDLGDEYVGRRVKGECPAKMYKPSRFMTWAETLLGREIPIGTPFDTDDLIGLTAEISIGHRQDRKDPAKIWEYVDEVLPVDVSTYDEPPF